MKVYKISFGRHNRNGIFHPLAERFVKSENKLSEVESYFCKKYNEFSVSVHEIMDVIDLIIDVEEKKTTEATEKPDLEILNGTNETTATLRGSTLEEIEGVSEYRKLLFFQQKKREDAAQKIKDNLLSKFSIRCLSNFKVNLGPSEKGNRNYCTDEISFWFRPWDFKFEPKTKASEKEPSDDLPF